MRQVGWNIRNQQIQNDSDDEVNVSNSDDAETHQINKHEIAELHKQLESQSIDKREQTPIKETELNQSFHSSQQQQCRICFSEEIDRDEDPLISPCKCSGSMSFVHIKCLRLWHSRNENKKIGSYVTSYTWKAFHCELCKQKLDDSYLLMPENKRFSLCHVEKP